MKRLWKTRLSALLLTAVMLLGMIPAAGAASPDFSYTVDADDKVVLDEDDFSDYYDDNVSRGSLEYVEFTSVPSFDNYGYFYTYDYNGRKVTLDEDELGDYSFYLNKSDMGRGDLRLVGLTFAADEDASSRTLSFDFVTYGTSGKKTEGTFSLKVDGSGSSSSSGDISVEVDEDDYVTLSSRKFKSFFDAKSSEGLSYVYFDYDKLPSKLDNYGHFSTKNDRNRNVNLDKSDLKDAEFFYDSADVTGSDEYTLDDLVFNTESDTGKQTLSLPFYAVGVKGKSVRGTLEIKIASTSSSSSTKGDITVEVDEDDDVTLSSRKFKSFFDGESSEGFSHIYFDYKKLPSKLDNYGYFSSKNSKNRTANLKKSDLDGADFYYDSDDVTSSDEYTLDDLTFNAESDAGKQTLSLPFYAVGIKGKEVKGTLVIQINGSSSNSSTTKKGDINYTAKPKEEAEFDPDDFNDFYQKSYSGDMLYVRFTDSTNLKASNGKLYYRYDTSKEESFDASDLSDYYFYYDKSEIPSDDTDCYPLQDLSFVAASGFDGSVTLNFTIYNTSKSSTRKVNGTVVISSSDTTDAVTVSSVRYLVSGGNALQINANDLARAYTKYSSGGTLQSVTLLNAPTTGTLYYDYYGSGRTQITNQNCGTQTYYRSPSSGQYDLSQFTYLPSGSNYCTTILYNARGTSGTIIGSILISVTKSAVSEVYGVTPKNTTVSLPASSIYNVVYNATGTALDSIQLLELPAASVGTVSINDGYVLKADTSTKYSYSGGTMAKLRFVPASDYTGSVEIPYLAYDKSGKSIAAGKFCLGVVSTRKTFSDVSSSTWCYKYVTELSSAGVIDGYSNGTFKEKNSITYGAALKLIMLAAGYAEQPKTGSHVFSGYLAKAQADGLVSGNVDLNKPITRLQVSQLAAKAMKLSTSNLSSVQPFTDTSDVYVQALNAAGIVEGYFSGGSSTFKPNNTLTRGQVSAIVWRMRNYMK